MIEELITMSKRIREIAVDICEHRDGTISYTDGRLLCLSCEKNVSPIKLKVRHLDYVTERLIKII